MLNTNTLVYGLLICGLFACGGEEKNQTETSQTETVEPETEIVEVEVPEESIEAIEAPVEEEPEKVIRNIEAWTDPERKSLDNIERPMENYTYEPVASLADFREQFLPKKKVIPIEPEEETVITCDKGTKIYIPENAFDLGADDTNVTVEVTEFASKLDFIAQELTTTSNGHLLESGGMINIIAKSNGRDLELKDEEEIVLFFPKKGQGEGMETFYGVEKSNGSIDWIPRNPESKPASEGSDFEDDYRVYREDEMSDIKAEKRCIFDINHWTSAIGKEPVTWLMKKDGTRFFDYFESTFSSLKITEKMRDDFCGENLQALFDVTIDEYGKIQTIEFDKSVGREYDYLIVDFLKTAPALDVSSMPGYQKNDYTLGFNATLRIDREKYKAEFKKKYSKYQDQALEAVDANELNYFVTASNQLGWINCDRFVNDTEEKLDMMVQADRDQKLKLFLVFEDINSVMKAEPITASRMAFKNIPDDRPVKIIGLSFEGDQPTMAIKRTRVSDQEIALENFSPFSIKELEEQFR